MHPSPAGSHRAPPPAPRRAAGSPTPPRADPPQGQRTPRAAPASREPTSRIRESSPPPPPPRTAPRRRQSRIETAQPAPHPAPATSSSVLLPHRTRMPSHAPPQNERERSPPHPRWRRHEDEPLLPPPNSLRRHGILQPPDLLDLHRDPIPRL